MNVILSRLGITELRTYCREALDAELADTYEVLTRAVAVTQRLEEVQSASLQLWDTMLEDMPTVWTRVQQLDKLRIELSKSMDLLVTNVLEKQEWVAVKNEESKKRDNNVVDLCEEATTITTSSWSVPTPTTAGTESSSTFTGSETGPSETPKTPSKKRKLLSTTSSESDKQELKKKKKQTSVSTSTSASSPASSAATASHQTSLSRALKKCGDFCTELSTKKMNVRVESFRTLMQKFHSVQKRLGIMVEADTAATMGALQLIVSCIVNIIVKGKPELTRHSAQQLLKNIMEVQRKFASHDTSFDKNVNALSKYIDATFPLTRKKKQELKNQVRLALSEVNAWTEKSYTVTDFMEKMKVVRVAMDSNCANWKATSDKTVLELLHALADRLDAFGDSPAQVKRTETLQAWISLMDADLQITKTPKKKKSLKTVSTVGSEIKEPNKKPSKNHEPKDTNKPSATPSTPNLQISEHDSLSKKADAKQTSSHEVLAMESDSEQVNQTNSLQKKSEKRKTSIATSPHLVSESPLQFAASETCSNNEIKSEFAAVESASNVNKSSSPSVANSHQRSCLNGSKEASHLYFQE